MAEERTEEEEREESAPGNTGLPFGLCAKYGIALPANATPRMAWEALKRGTGLTPEQVYAGLKDEEEKKRESAERVYDDAYDSRDGQEGSYQISDNEKQFLSYAQREKLEYRKVHRNAVPLAHEEIIAKVAGGDETEGSCVSVALAYIGNTIGFDVTDFRGGESQKFFANKRNLMELLSFDGIEAYSLEGYNDFTTASKVLSTAVSGREYLFVAGKHAAIVRRGEEGFEYLELQSPESNGYRPLTMAELKNRFGCQKSHTIYGIRLKNSCHLVRLESFSNSNAFVEILGYINTATQNQKKGESGSVK